MDIFVLSLLLLLYRFLLNNKMENRPKTTQKPVQKFKPLKPSPNDLHSKYDIYKNGSPNSYSQNLDTLKAYPIKNSIKMLDLPALDYLLQEIKNVPANTGTNLRDYLVHPSMGQRYGTRFRDLVSDGQEIRDFLAWFQGKEREIGLRDCQARERFELNQSLIAAGFNEMLVQLSSISRMRTETLRMLWNKQTAEITQIFNHMHRQSRESQKQSLQTIKSLHLGYQEQIISLRNENYCAQKKLQEAALLNEGCINSLRTMRKQIKKYEKIIKQLTEANYFLKAESVQILEENIGLIMKEKGISFEKARVLSYQALRLGQMKAELRKNKKAKNLFKDVKNKAESMVENSEMPDLDCKKEKLVKFITERIKENPGEKTCIMKGEFSDQDDEEIKLEKTIEEMLNCKELRAELQSKIPKKFNFFDQKGINTDPIEIALSPQEAPILQSTSTQTCPSQHPKINLLNPLPQEQLQGKSLLQRKKIQQRHSLIMIQMNKMMQFKKCQDKNKTKRVSPFSQTTQGFSHFLAHNRYSSADWDRDQGEEDRKIKEVQSDSEVSQSETVGRDREKGRDMDRERVREREREREEGKDTCDLKKREINIMRRHHQSLLTQKSSEFQQMIQIISRQSSFAQPEKQSQSHEPPSLKPQPSNSPLRYDELTQKIPDLKTLIKKYLQKRLTQSPTPSPNPQKPLKKILTDTFKNIYISKKYNFFKEMLRTAKNSYGKVIYENKVIHLMALVLENRGKSLLGALAMLLGVQSGQGGEADGVGYEKVNYQDVSEIYFKLYFCLSSKSPVESQFNIWSNYTTVQRMNSPNFSQLLHSYFSDSKCLYLQLKIRQFIGMGQSPHSSLSPSPLSQQPPHPQNNYYIQINPLMLYILQVYMLEKQNYYDSYHEIVDFLADGQGLRLGAFVFLMDLLCFKEEEQREIIRVWFHEDRKDDGGCCHKDVFYRICVKYQLPLFQFLKLLKLQQFKKLPECLQTEFTDISEPQKWTRVRENIEKMLTMKGIYTANLRNLIGKLNCHIKSGGILGEAFLFFYRIVIHAAYSCV